MAGMFDDLIPSNPASGSLSFDDLIPAKKSGKHLTFEEGVALLEEEERQAGKAASEGFGRQALSGWLEGATGALGAPVDLVNNLVVAPALKGVNAALGTDFQPSSEPLGGSAGLRRGLAISPDTEQVAPHMVRRIAQSVGGASVPLAGSARTAGEVGAGLASAVGGGVGGAVAQQAFPGNVGAEVAGELIGGLGTGAVANRLATNSARKAAEAAVPDVDELKRQASGLYKAAEARGVVAGAAETQKLADDIARIARNNELITPTGRVSTAYPKAKEALDLMSDYAGYDMNPTQMQVIRETLADAAMTTEGKESRIATQMLKAFDDFSVPIAPELSEARNVAQRYIKGQQLETLRELAGVRAGDFKGSGFENALRTEYRGLDRKIVKGQESGWSPEQVEAIQRVGRGTTASNAARNIGKLAPTGAVSFLSSAGVPFVIGNAFGGPSLGTTLAAATSLGGYGARALATGMGVRNAELAELAARNGGAVMTPSMQALQRRIFEAILGGQAAQLNARSQPN